MENKNQSANIYQRMLAATSEINKVAKNLKVEITKTKSYNAVSEADVLEAVKPIEEKHGIYSYPVSRKIIETNVFTTQRTNDYGTTEVNTLFMRIETVYRFVNVDEANEFVDITTYGDGVDTQDKAPGKAMTYADKYALLKAYKIQTGDDPDANGSKEMQKPKAPVAPLITKEQIDELTAFGVDLSEVAKYFKAATINEVKQAEAQLIIAKKRKEKAAADTAAAQAAKATAPKEEVADGQK